MSCRSLFPRTRARMEEDTRASSRVSSENIRIRGSAENTARKYLAINTARNISYHINIAVTPRIVPRPADEILPQRY